MVKVYLKNGKVLTFENSKIVTASQEGYYIVGDTHKDCAIFNKDEIIGVTYTYPDKIEDLLSDAKRENLRLQESINNII